MRSDKQEITKTKLRQLCKEFNLRYKEDEADCVDIDFNDAVLTNDCGEEGSLLSYCGKNYVIVKTGLQLLYYAINSRMKIIWTDEEIMIDTMKDLRKYCKNMIEQYEQFKFYQKQFKKNIRIKDISKDFK